MARLCERPGCSAPASVAYGFEADRYLVFLQPFDPELADGVRAGVLCRRHADALTPPRGWWLDDRREARPRLFVPRTPAPDPSHFSQRTRTARTRRPKPEPTPPTLFEEPAPDQVEPTEAPPVALPPTAASDPPAASEAPAASEPPKLDPPNADPPAVAPAGRDLEETRAIAWVPAFDAADDLGGVLRARSPLLSRAFGARPDKPF